MELPFETKFVRMLCFLLAGIILLCTACDICRCSSTPKEFAKVEDFLYLGSENVKMHGPVSGKNHEDYRVWYMDKYMIGGHDYFYAFPRTGSSSDYGITHDPRCRACENEKQIRDSLIKSSTKEILDTLRVMGANNISQEEIERLVRKTERNIVRKFDEILDSWD